MVNRKGFEEHFQKSSQESGISIQNCGLYNPNSGKKKQEKKLRH